MKNKKIVAILLAAFVIASFLAGCSQKGADTSPKPAPASDAPGVSAAPSETPADDYSQAPGPFKLPIVEQTATFTAFEPVNVSLAGMTDNNDSYAYQEAEKRTNVHIKWFHPSTSDTQSSFSLSVASGDYYDAYMVTSASFTGGLDSYIDDKVILDLTDLVAEYAPNYDYVRHQDGTLVSTITDGGNLPGFWQIAKTYQWSWLGPLGRTDWLKELGLEIPETYDQLHDVLTAFKEKKNCEIPLSLGATGVDDWLLAGFDTTYSPTFGSPFIQIDGVVKFGPLEPGFKEYITLMHQWYSEGLIDKDFFSRTSNPAFDTALASADKVGVGQSLYTFPDFIPLFAKTQPYEFNAFKVPVKNIGDKRKVVIGGAPLSLNKNVISTISTACADPVTLVKWFDYYFTEDGSLLSNYGIEGQGFNYDANGKPKVTELIYADKTGLPMYAMMYRYTFAQLQGNWYDWERELTPTSSQNVFDTKERWDGNWDDQYSMPNVSPTSQESAEYTAIISDINTLISENLIQFITGQKPMSQYDAFVAEIKALNIDRATAIQQAALDRYNARIK